MERKEVNGKGKWETDMEFPKQFGPRLYLTTDLWSDTPKAEDVIAVSLEDCEAAWNKAVSISDESHYFEGSSKWVWVLFLSTDPKDYVVLRTRQEWETFK